MTLSEYIGMAFEKEIMILVKDIEGISRLKVPLITKLRMMGRDPHVYNMSHIWLKDQKVNVHMIRSDYIAADMYGRVADCLFIHEDVDDRKFLTASLIVRQKDGNFFMKKFTY